MSTAEYPDALTRRIELLAAAAVEELEGESTKVTALVGAVRAEIGAVRTELASLRFETGAVRGDLGGLGGRLTGAVDAVASDLHEALTAALAREARSRAGASAALEDARTAVEARLAVLEDVLDAMSERLEALGRDGARTTTDTLAVLETRVGELTTRVEEQGRADAEQVVDRLGEVTRTRASELETTLLARLSDVLAARDEELRRELTIALEASRAEAAEDRQAVQELGSSVRGALDGFGSALDERRQQDHARLDDLGASLLDAVAAVQTDLARRLTASDSAVTRRVDELVAAVTAQQAASCVDLAALTATVTRSAETTGEAAGAVSALEGSTAELSRMVAGFRAEWPTRTFEVVEGAKAVAEGVVREVREQVAVQLEQVRAELARAAGGVDGVRADVVSGTDRLSDAGAVLVAYLEQRDRLLEAERDRVLHEVLDTFATGLSSRDRAALSGRVGDALARRRDARDAERYRTAAAPASAVVPAEVRRLAERADSPDPRAADPRASDPRASELPAPFSMSSPTGAPEAARPSPPVRPSSSPLARPSSLPATTAKVALPRVGGAPAVPGRSIVARPAAARTTTRITAAQAATTPLASAGPLRSTSAQPAPTRSDPADAASQVATAQPAAPAALSTPGAPSGPSRQHGSDRRARVDVMPEVRSPDVAIEAAAPTPVPAPGPALDPAPAPGRPDAGE